MNENSSTYAASFRRTFVHELIYCLNTLGPRQNGRHFADDIFKCIFLNENVWISLKIALKFVPRVRINNIPTLVQIMAWRRSGDKPLCESILVSLPTHICVTRPQWVNGEIPVNAHIPYTTLHRLTHWGRDEVDAISQTTYSNAFSWKKMSEFRLKFHWSLFLRVQLTIFHHCFR